MKASYVVMYLGALLSASIVQITEGTFNDIVGDYEDYLGCSLGDIAESLKGGDDEVSSCVAFQNVRDLFSAGWTVDMVVREYVKNSIVLDEAHEEALVFQEASLNLHLLVSDEANEDSPYGQNQPDGLNYNDRFWVKNEEGKAKEVEKINYYVNEGDVDNFECAKQDIMVADGRVEFARIGTRSSPSCLRHCFSKLLAIIKLAKSGALDDGVLSHSFMKTWLWKTTEFFERTPKTTALEARLNEEGVYCQSGSLLSLLKFDYPSFVPGIGASSPNTSKWACPAFHQLNSVLEYTGDNTEMASGLIMELETQTMLSNSSGNQLSLLYPWLSTPKEINLHWGYSTRVESQEWKCDSFRFSEQSKEKSFLYGCMMENVYCTGWTDDTVQAVRERTEKVLVARRPDPDCIMEYLEETLSIRQTNMVPVIVGVVSLFLAVIILCMLVLWKIASPRKAIRSDED